jgi:hypothetical protein
MELIDQYINDWGKKREASTCSIFSSHLNEKRTKHSELAACPDASENTAEYNSTPEALFKSIADPDPFAAIYCCDNIHHDENLVKELNRRIRKGLKNCTPLLKENRQ